MSHNDRSIGSISRSKAREIDHRAVAEFGMSSLVLMENAGRGLADDIFRLGVRGPVVICCGVGNNGGDGFVLARHLDLRRVQVQVFVWGDANRFSPDALSNFEILERRQPRLNCAGLTHFGSRWQPH